MKTSKYLLASVIAMMFAYEGVLSASNIPNGQGTFGGTERVFQQPTWWVGRELTSEGNGGATLKLDLTHVYPSIVQSGTQYDIRAGALSADINKLRSDSHVEYVAVAFNTASEENYAALINLIREKAKRLHLDFSSDLNGITARFLAELSSYSGSHVSITLACTESAINALVQFLQNNSSNINIIELRLYSEIKDDDLQKIADALTEYHVIDLIGDTNSWHASNIRTDNAVTLQKMLKEITLIACVHCP